MSEIPVIHDPQDPNPWMALSLDHSTFIEQRPKDALLRGNASRSRQFLLPILRPMARLTIILVQLLRIVLPNSLTSSKVLHVTICWGMKYFVSKDANYLILRHFHIGSQILAFLNANLAGGRLSSHPLYPCVIGDLKDNVFLQHDLNIYNFIIELNQHLQKEKRDIQSIALEKVDFSMIRDCDELIEPLPDTWHNFMDLQSAIEFYTPLFGLFLSDTDFWRSSNSLQLDETVAIYVAKIFEQPGILGVVSNKHPMVPFSTLEAGFRLMLHGLDAENLYGFIKTHALKSGKP